MNQNKKNHSRFKKTHAGNPKNSDARANNKSSRENDKKPRKVKSSNWKSKKHAGTQPDYSHKSFDKKNTASESEAIRLNRFIANAGVCSRRDADKLISEGAIKVNGKIVTTMGFKVSYTDKITYQGKLLKSEKLVYVLLNKPKDFITTTSDPNHRRTVMNLVSNACKERIYPVGRLDRNTTGLLLLTNDGELAKRLAHPSHNVKKVYQVDLDQSLKKEDIKKINDGLTLDDGPVVIDDFAILSPDNKSIGLELHLGRNRIVRRLFEHLGYQVEKLDRVVYAGLTKKDLKRGNWRYLSQKEVIKLKFLS